MNALKNAIPALLFPAMFITNFAPLNYTILIFILFTLGGAADNLRKNKDVPILNKYILVAGIYLVIFAVLMSFFYYHGISLFLKE